MSHKVLCLIQVNTSVRNAGTAARSVSWSPAICHPARDIVSGRQQVTTSRKSATFVGSSPLTRKAQLQRGQLTSHTVRNLILLLLAVRHNAEVTSLVVV